MWRKVDLVLTMTKLWVTIFLFGGMGFIFGYSAEKQPPYLIHFTPSTVARPSAILANLQYIESLPFDGIVINIPLSWFCMDPSYTFTYEDVYNSWLQPLKGKFKNLTQNFLLMKIRNPPDLFDSWDKVINHWKIAARGAKAIGLVGLLFDNEEDRPEDALWTYPDAVGYPQKSFAEYRSQAILRGQQIMNAIESEYPGIKVIILHGPYVSEPKTPWWMCREQVAINEYDLRGPFFAGMLQAADQKYQVIDGGEFYHHRTFAQFRATYEWRKTGIASSQVNCHFINSTLRSQWSQKIGIAWGVYDQNWKPNYAPMNPEIMTTTLAHALRNADEYVWYYTDSGNPQYLKPGEIDSSWWTAIREGRKLAKEPYQPPSHGSNLLINGGFEQDLTGWNDWGNIQIQTQEIYQGQKSLKAGPQQGGCGQVITNLTIGKKYVIAGAGKLSGYPFGSASNTFRASFGIRFRNSQNQIIQEEVIPVFGISYLYDYRVVKVPSQTSNALVWVWKNEGDNLTLSWDNVLFAPCVTSPVSFSPSPGIYSSPIQVSLDSNTPQVNIRYTVDLSTPTVSSGSIYTQPILISKNTTIQAIAYTDDLFPSSVAKGSYIINRPPVIESGPWVLSGPVRVNVPTFLEVVASDSDQDSLTFYWKQLSGPVALSLPPENDHTSCIQLIFPSPGTYTIQVTVSDPYHQVHSHELSVEVDPSSNQSSSSSSQTPPKRSSSGCQFLFNGSIFELYYLLSFLLVFWIVMIKRKV